MGKKEGRKNSTVDEEKGSGDGSCRWERRKDVRIVRQMREKKEGKNSEEKIRDQGSRRGEKEGSRDNG